MPNCPVTCCRPRGPPRHHASAGCPEASADCDMRRAPRAITPVALVSVQLDPGVPSNHLRCHAGPHHPWSGEGAAASAVSRPNPRSSHQALAPHTCHVLPHASVVLPSYSRPPCSPQPLCRSGPASRSGCAARCWSWRPAPRPTPTRCAARVRAVVSAARSRPVGVCYPRLCHVPSSKLGRHCIRCAPLFPRPLAGCRLWSIVLKCDLFACIIPRPEPERRGSQERLRANANGGRRGLCALMRTPSSRACTSFATCP